MDDAAISRALRAKRILESEEWTGAWTAYRTVLLDVIENSSDDAKALEARRQLRAAGAARAHLERLIADGQVAQFDLESLKSRLRLA